MTPSLRLEAGAALLTPPTPSHHPPALQRELPSGHRVPPAPRPSFHEVGHEPGIDLLGTRPGPRQTAVPSWGSQPQPLPTSMGGHLPPRWHPAGFLVPAVVSLQTLPFVARLNSSMGPGRTVVIKGEVNAKAKGWVPLSERKSATFSHGSPLGSWEIPVA